MTNEELAHEIASVSIDNIDEVVDLAFTEIEASRSAEEVELFSMALFACGVDVRPLCKKKHPAS